jgi:hypothetical protein
LVSTDSVFVSNYKRGVLPVAISTVQFGNWKLVRGIYHHVLCDSLLQLRYLTSGTVTKGEKERNKDKKRNKGKTKQEHRRKNDGKGKQYKKLKRNRGK